MTMARGDLGSSMSLWEVALRASYDYPFIELSRAVPDTPISMWCLWNRELLQVPSRDPKLLKEVEKILRRTGHVVDQWADAKAARLFLLDCTCSRYRNSLWNMIEANQCWDDPPVVYQNGWANFRVISFEADRPKHLFDELRKQGRAELVRKRELSLSVLPTSVWTHVLFGDLTAKQAQSLLSAHRFGYYSSPRQVTTEHIAASLGVGRTTYEEHLRKAENRVISALIPYLELFAMSERPPDRLPFPTVPVEPPAEDEPAS
jgi:predicted DNA binding protein